MLTCRGLFQLDSFKEISLVAGRAGLDNEISWPYPKHTKVVSPWVRGGEFILVAACFIGTAAVIFLPFFFNMVLCNLFLPHNNNTWIGAYQMHNFQGYVLGTNLVYETPYQKLAFAKLFLNHRLLYSFIYLVAISLFSGLLGTVILGLSFIFNQSKILLFIPLFAAQHISQTYNTKALNNAISNGDTYTNLNILEYVIPEFSKGKSPIFLVIVLGFLALFVLISFLFSQREDIRSLQ